MPEYDNKNSGILFKNDRKTEDKHPDYTGSYTDCEGRECFLDGWIKQGKSGKKFISLRTKVKTAKKQESAPAPAPTDGEDSPF
jgi:uncharacterized protein (DUF736 family)